MLDNMMLMAAQNIIFTGVLTIPANDSSFAKIECAKAVAMGPWHYTYHQSIEEHIYGLFSSLNFLFHLFHPFVQLFCLIQME